MSTIVNIAFTFFKDANIHPTIVARLGGVWTLNCSRCTDGGCANRHSPPESHRIQAVRENLKRRVSLTLLMICTRTDTILDVVIMYTIGTGFLTGYEDPTFIRHCPHRNYACFQDFQRTISHFCTYIQTAHLPGLTSAPYRHPLPPTTSYTSQ